MSSGQNPNFGRAAGGTPVLPAFNADDDTQAQLPEFSSVDHFRLAEWVRGALSVSDRRIRDHLAATATHLQTQITELVGAVRALDARGADAASDRKQLAEQMDNISAQLNQLLGHVNAETSQKGWLNPRHFPYLLTAVVVLFMFALMWGIVFGDDSVATTLDRIRGNAPSHQTSEGPP